MKAAYFWEVQWMDRTTNNLITSDGGPYRDRINAECGRDRCLEQLLRNECRLDNHTVEIRDVAAADRMIEDIEHDEYVPQFTIDKANPESFRMRIYGLNT